MGIAIATIFSLLTLIFSVLFHLACAAAIVVLFVLYLNAKSEQQQRKYMTVIIILAISLVLLLISRPILIWLGITSAIL